MAEYQPGQKLEEEIIDNKIILYAVWRQETTNARKKELQDYYGADVMPDYYFETQYESPDWEWISDRCCFVIKTRNLGDPGSPKSMHTEIMVLEYRCGKWCLTGDPISAKATDQWEYEIATSFNDDEARLWLAGKDVVLTVVDRIPIAGKMLTAEEIMGELINISERLTYTKTLDEEAVIRVSSSIANMIFSSVKDGYGDSAFLSDWMVETGTLIFDSLIGAVSINANSITDGIERLLEYTVDCVNTFTSDKYKRYEQNAKKFFEDAEANINKDFSVGVRIGLAEFDIVENLDSSGLFDFVKVDLLKCIFSIVADNVKYTINNKNLDPFGDFHGGLQQFQIELDNKHFSSQVINSCV